ncbi:hypothetical protein [Paenibacillus sp. HJGM_3]|uniref:hypothetical protein n=1 Tax=Paenibacillus sp. HJGM_3 TaxID=3379816 RepID=UPI003859E377
MAISPSLKALDVYPIMMGGALHGHHGEYDRRPDGGLASMKELHCTLTNFVLPSDLPECRALGLRAIVRQDHRSWHSTREPEEFFSQDELDRRARELVDACRPYRDTVLAYYIFDEPSTQQFAYIREIIEAIRRYDPDTTCFVNLYPSHAKRTQLGVDEHVEDPFGAYLQQYADVVQPNNFIRYDNFQVSHVRGDQSEDDRQRLRSYFSDLLQVREFAFARGLQAWNTACSCQIRPHASIPTPANLGFQAYTTLAAGYKGLAWYSFYKSTRPAADGSYYYELSPIDAALDHERTETFYYLQEVNRQARLYGDRLMAMTSTGVRFRNIEPYRLSSMNVGVGEVVADAVVEGDLPLMIGEFRDPEGDRWFMVVNLDMGRTAKLRLRLQSGFTGLHSVSLGSGRLRPVRTDEAIFLAPGTGRLYKADHHTQQTGDEQL